MEPDRLHGNSIIDEILKLDPKDQIEFIRKLPTEEQKRIMLFLQGRAGKGQQTKDHIKLFQDLFTEKSPMPPELGRRQTIAGIVVGGVKQPELSPEERQRIINVNTKK